MGNLKGAGFSFSFSARRQKACTDTNEPESAPSGGDDREISNVTLIIEKMPPQKKNLVWMNARSYTAIRHTTRQVAFTPAFFFFSEDKGGVVASLCQLSRCVMGWLSDQGAIILFTTLEF